MVYSWNKWFSKAYNSPLTYVGAMRKKSNSDEEEIKKEEGWLVWSYVLLGIVAWPAFLYAVLLFRDDIREFDTDIENDIRG